MDKRYLDEDGLSIVAGKVNMKVEPVKRLPLDAIENKTVIYSGETGNNVIKGHIYKYETPHEVTFTLSAPGTDSTGFILSNFSEFPYENNGWYFDEPSNVELFRELIISGETITFSSSPRFTFEIYPEPDPMIIGAMFNALHASWKEGQTPSPSAYSITLQWGESRWVDITDDGTSAANKVYNTLEQLKNDTFQFDSLPTNIGYYLGKNIQLESNGYFYKGVGVGELEDVDTTGKFHSFLSDYGRNIMVIAEPYAGQSGSVLINGYQYFWDSVTGGGAMKVETDTFHNRIDLFNGEFVVESVSLQEIIDLGLRVYTDFDWEQIVFPDSEAREVAAGAMALAEAVSEKTTVTKQTLASGNTSVTFTVPTSGDYMVDFFISDGSSYNSINTSVAGQVTVNYDSANSNRTVMCRIEEA